MLCVELKPACINQPANQGEPTSRQETYIITYQPTNQPTNQGEPTSQQETHLITYQPTNQPTHQPANQCELTRQPKVSMNNQPTANIQLNCKLNTQPTKQPTSQITTKQPTKQIKRISQITKQNYLHITHLQIS